MPLVRNDILPSPALSPATDFLAALASTNDEERWAAARALAKVPGSEAALCGALVEETIPQVREAIFTSLALLHTAEAVEAILPHIRSSDASIRTGALDALSAMPDAVAGYIPTLLTDRESDVRLLVCDVVRKLPGPVATQTLCVLLDIESEPNVCAAAIEVLSEVGDPAALPVLARCAKRFSHEPFLVFAIRIASHRIEGSARIGSSEPL